MPAYKDKTGRWRYRFVKNGTRYSGSTPKDANTKRSADELAKQHADSIITGLKRGERAPLIRDFARQFLEHQKPRTKPLTQRQQKATLENYVVPVIGHLRVDEVGREQLDRMTTEWRKTLAAKTVNARLGTLRRMLSIAAEWSIIPGVPKVQFLKVPKKHPRFLTDAECTALLAASDEHWRSMVFIGLRTGLRIGELRGLQWGDVDFRRKVVAVRRTDPGVPGLPATDPKGNNEREVPLSPDALACLVGLHAQGKRKATDWVWPAPRWRGAKVDKTRSESGCQHALERAALDTGLAGLEDITWHVLRHTFASHAVMRGVPLRQVQKWLGHSSIVQTEVYSHLSPEYGANAAALLDSPLLGSNQGATNQDPLALGSGNDYGTTPE